MKPVPFDYVAPRTVRQAVEALGDPSREARVLAGGQSLIMEMRLRRATPRLVVDINRVGGLGRLTVSAQGTGGAQETGAHGTGGVLEVGALVRHAAFERPGAVPGPLGRLFALAAAEIAHPPIRARGTMAGSLAWAHPASEWCALAVALDAVLVLDAVDGARAVAARDFFLGPHLTAREARELLTLVRFPLLADGTGVAFAEHRRTCFSFAQVAVAAAVTLRDGVVEDARIGLANCADRPVRARLAERSLIGAEIGPPGARPAAGHPFARAGAVAAERDAGPVPEPYADPDYRRHVAAVLVRRALREAAADAERRPEGVDR
ncbi:FAD binding domain-containing protein [Microbispora sp. RL4-1S]|uniref:FAD binding domain-containing protein n=1 Tax=Microbispora oryzae TaxID=2806554 RepID=A0A941AL64_9ACTN|nr:FAD binding domain-containing protein [Microbispora oryzae]MBP2706887.1 FAD binding domain-containing protein [Microbispora oryzae]